MGWEASEEKEKMSVQRQEEEMHTWEREGKKMQDEFEERIWFFDDNDGGRCVEERERKKKKKKIGKKKLLNNKEEIRILFSGRAIQLCLE